MCKKRVSNGVIDDAHPGVEPMGLEQGSDGLMQLS